MNKFLVVSRKQALVGKLFEKRRKSAESHKKKVLAWKLLGMKETPVDDTKLPLEDSYMKAQQLGFMGIGGGSQFDKFKEAPKPSNTLFGGLGGVTGLAREKSREPNEVPQSRGLFSGGLLTSQQLATEKSKDVPEPIQTGGGLFGSLMPNKEALAEKPKESSEPVKSQGLFTQLTTKAKESEPPKSLLMPVSLEESKSSLTPLGSSTLGLFQNTQPTSSLLAQGGLLASQPKSPQGTPAQPLFGGLSSLSNMQATSQMPKPLFTEEKQTVEPKPQISSLLATTTPLQTSQTDSAPNNSASFGGASLFGNAGLNPSADVSLKPVSSSLFGNLTTQKAETTETSQQPSSSLFGSAQASSSLTSNLAQPVQLTSKPEVVINPLPASSLFSGLSQPVEKPLLPESKTDQPTASTASANPTGLFSKLVAEKSTEIASQNDTSPKKSAEAKPQQGGLFSNLVAANTNTAPSGETALGKSENEPEQPKTGGLFGGPLTGTSGTGLLGTQSKVEETTPQSSGASLFGNVPLNTSAKESNKIETEQTEKTELKAGLFSNIQAGVTDAVSSTEPTVNKSENEPTKPQTGGLFGLLTGTPGTGLLGTQSKGEETKPQSSGASLFGNVPLNTSAKESNKVETEKTEPKAGLFSSLTAGTTEKGPSSIGLFGNLNNQPAETTSINEEPKHSAGASLFGNIPSNVSTIAGDKIEPEPAKPQTGGLFSGLLTGTTGSSLIGTQSAGEETKPQPVGASLFGNAPVKSTVNADEKIETEQAEKTEPKTGLFSSLTAGTTDKAPSSSGLFGNLNNQPADSTSINEEPKPQSAGASLFGNIPSNVSPTTGDKIEPEPAKPQTGGLFSGLLTGATGSSLIGTQPAGEETKPQSAGASLFGNIPLNPTTNASEKIETEKNESKPQSGLFSNLISSTATETTPSKVETEAAKPQTSGLFGNLLAGTTGESITGTQPSSEASKPQQIGASLFGASAPQASGIFSGLASQPLFQASGPTTSKLGIFDVFTKPNEPSKLEPNTTASLNLSSIMPIIFNNCNNNL